MKIKDLHPWEQINLAEARNIQEELRSLIILEDKISISDIRRVAGIDNAYVKDGQITIAHAVVVILNFPNLEIIETQTASYPIHFPYIPGLLAFREAPAILKAYRLVENEPDLILFDAQGYAHFRRIGLASHLGLVLDRPSVGCAKSRLLGEYSEPEKTFGSFSILKVGGEVIGAAVRTRTSHSPLFVSPGHKISLATAIDITLACCQDNHFMPEPTRLANKLVNAQARTYRQQINVDQS
jgi:deoxyribonuclease V